MARINYESWDERKFVTGRLRLDAQNLRLSSQSGVLSPRNIVAYMFEHEKVMYLVRSIALKGYFVNEMPIVVQEGGYHVVIEGNRRITACKVLLDPSLAPDKYQAQIRYLASTFDVSSLNRIKCSIAPSRDEARVLIQNRHTGGSQIEKWDGMKQDTWYVNDIARGFTVDEIAAIYMQQKSKVLGSVFRYKLYDEAQHVEGLSNEAFRFVRGSEKFPISTLWRIGSNKKAAAFLGLEYTNAGDIETLLPSEEYNKRFAALLEDLAKGDIDSRALNSKDDIDQYIQNLKDTGSFDLTVVAEQGDKNAVDTEQLPEEPSDNTAEEDADFSINIPQDQESDSDETPPPNDNPTPTPAAPRRRRTRRAQPSAPEVPEPLINGMFSCQTTIPKIDAVFAELQEIPLDKPNAVAVLFRTLLELLLTKYVEQKGLLERITDLQIQTYVKSNRKIEDNLIVYLKRRYNVDETAEDAKRILKLKEEVAESWFPSLGFMLQFFDENATELITHARTREAFLSYRRQQGLVTHSEFNQFVHSPEFLANPAVLREFWSSFATFITFLINGINGAEDEVDDEPEVAQQ